MQTITKTTKKTGKTTTTKKPKRVSLPKGLAPKDVTLSQALFLLEFPKDMGEGISLSTGRFGPYLKQGDSFYSVKEDIFNLDLERAKQIIAETKRKKEGTILGVHPKTQEDIILKYDRFGPYLVYQEQKIKIPKELKTKEINLETALSIIG